MASGTVGGGGRRGGDDGAAAARTRERDTVCAAAAADADTIGCMPPHSPPLPQASASVAMQACSTAATKRSLAATAPPAASSDRGAARGGTPHAAAAKRTSDAAKVASSMPAPDSCAPCACDSAATRGLKSRTAKCSSGSRSAGSQDANEARRIGSGKHKRRVSSQHAAAVADAGGGIRRPGFSTSDMQPRPGEKESALLSKTIRRWPAGRFGVSENLRPLRFCLGSAARGSHRHSRVGDWLE